MTTFSNGESGSSVRTKLNEIINKVEGVSDINNNLTVDGNFTVTGDLTVQGTTITVDSATAQTITLGDNDKMTFGAGPDLQIYHTGAYSYIQDVGTGNLILDTNGSSIALTYNDAEYLASFVANGAATLFYDNAAKLATTSTGVDVTGTITADALTVDNTGGASSVVTVSGNDQANVRITLDNNGTGGNEWELVGGNHGANNADLTIYDKTNTAKRAVFSNNGNISFYEDTGTTAKFFWDASAEALGINKTSSLGTAKLEIKGAGNTNATNSIFVEDSGAAGVFAVRDNGEVFIKDSLGIGTSSPVANTPLTLQGPSGYTDTLWLKSVGTNIDSRINIAPTGTGNAQINNTTGTAIELQISGTERLRIDSSGSVIVKSGNELRLNRPDDATYGAISHGASGIGIVYNDANGDGHHWQFAGVEKMRLDASGNLLVGKTAATISTDGAELRPTGEVVATTNGLNVAYFNRRSSDGSIAEFRKDGTTVGSIGADGGNLVIDGSVSTGKSGIEFSGAEWLPRDAGANTDGAISLGDGSNRFKNLYLSGGVYLGGTGAANLLDDYEEGLHVTTVSADTGTPTVGSAEDSLSYTKIGNKVFINGQIGTNNCSGCSGAYYVTMPFVAETLAERSDYYYAFAHTNIDQDISYLYLVQAGGGSSTFQVNARMNDGTNNSNVATLLASAGNFDISIASMHYKTSS